MKRTMLRLRVIATGVNVQVASFWLTSLTVIWYAVIVLMPVRVEADGSCCIVSGDCINEPGTYCDRNVTCSAGLGSCVANT